MKTVFVMQLYLYEFLLDGPCSLQLGLNYLDKLGGTIFCQNIAETSFCEELWENNQQKHFHHKVSCADGHDKLGCTTLWFQTKMTCFVFDWINKLLWITLLYILVFFHMVVKKKLSRLASDQIHL